MGNCNARLHSQCDFRYCAFCFKVGKGEGSKTMINCKKITVQQYGLLWLLLLEKLVFVLKAKILSFGVSNGNIYHKVG